MARKKADEALVEALKTEGVRYVFGLPGGHSVKILYNAIRDDPDIEAVLARHETAGAFTALGYAQMTAEPVVCHGTAGPGWAQTIPGVHEAFAAHIPLICLVAAAPTADYGKGALQEFPQYESMLTCTKWAYRVDRADKIPWVMRQAFKHALAPPPGPVFVEVPIDIPDEVVEMPEYAPAPRVKMQANPVDVDIAVRILLDAHRPVLIAGRGIHQARAWTELREFAELLHLPVLTTNSGKTAIPENHPLYAGGVGCNETLVSEAFMSTTDCMFWIGSQIEEFAARNWPPLRPEQRFIHADADPGQFGRNWVPDVALLGDAKLVLRQLIQAARDSAPRGSFRESAAAEEIAHLWHKYAQACAALPDMLEGAVHHIRVVEEVQRQMANNAVIVLGEGANRCWTASHLRIPAAGRWVSASDYGCMGFAVPAAIGAKLARPEARVIALTGDGSFQMQMQELPVAIQHRAPVTWIVMNNNCLGWIKWGQERYWSERFYATDFQPNWRFDKVAEACGCFGARAETPEELASALSSALQANEEGTPAVIDVRVPQLAQTPGFVVHHDQLRGGA